MTDASDATPARSNRVLIAVAVAAALIVALTCVIVGVLLSREGPTDATEAYLSAARDRDLDRVEAVVCTGDSPEIHSLLRIVDDSDELLEWRVISETVHGDSADVRVSVTFANRGEARTTAALFTLQRENSDWKVCSVREAGGPVD